MAKKKSTEETRKEFEVIEGTIKDDYCNYKYKICTGVGVGNEHTVKGKGIVDPDMKDAFRKFNVHLAAIDDVFKHANVDVKNIEKMHNNELTALYHVTGFSIKGGGEAECIVLKGSKHINATNGRIELETPKIPLDNLSSYPWYKELKAAADEARMEVELYHEGKCTEPEEDDDDPAQTNAFSDQEDEEQEEEDGQEEEQAAAGGKKKRTSKAKA